MRSRPWAATAGLAAAAALLVGLAAPLDAATVRTSWHSPSLDGTVQGAPAVVGDVIVVATEHDALYGLSLRDGHRVWGPRRVGQPVPLSVVASKAPAVSGCGDIDPLGITSSLVVDPGPPPTVFAVAQVLGPNAAVTHDLVGVDPATGRVVVGPTPIDPPAMLHPELEQQRAGLTFANGKVYVGFGGLYGDCGEYHGFVVAANPDGSGIAGTFETSTAGGSDRAAAVWATDNPPVDAAGQLYVATGNSEGAPGPPTFEYGDSVVALSPSLMPVSAFQPSTFQADNASDLDLGSTAPVLVGDGQVFELGKQQRAFLLSTANLGGADGHTPLASIDSCAAYGANASIGTSVYVACRNSLQQIVINRATNPPTLSHGWSASVPAGGPITVAGGLLWSVDTAGGTLYALNPTNGHVVAHHPISLDSSQHFPTPVVAGGWAIVETGNGLAAFTVPGARRPDMTGVPPRTPARSRRVARLTALLVLGVTVVAFATPAGAKARPSAADKVLLNAGVVARVDVPAGWTSTSQVDTSASQFKGVAGCRAVYRAVFNARATVPYKLSKAFSPPGPDNGITVVDDTVLAFKTVTRANRFFAVFQDAGTGPCLHAVLAKALRGEGHAVVAPLTVAPVGDATVGYEASITSTSPGLTGPQVGDIVVLRVGRVVAYVTTINAAAAPLPQTPAILAAIASRLQQAAT